MGGVCSCLVLLLLLVNPFRRTKAVVRKKVLYVSPKGKKKNYILVKNGLIAFKELVLKWRIKFALTPNCANALCCLFCLIPSLDPLRIFVLLVRCGWRGDACWRGPSAAACAVQNPWRRGNRVSPARRCAPALSEVAARDVEGLSPPPRPSVLLVPLKHMRAQKRLYGKYHLVVREEV